MSYSEWTVNGFGIDDKALTPTIKNAVEFLQKFCPDKYDQMMQDGAGEVEKDSEDFYLTCQDWIDDFEDDNCANGFPALFAIAVNNNEANFDVDYLKGEDTGAVVYCDRQPWEMSDRVKQMTEEDMENVFRKYLAELHLPYAEIAVERQSVLFCG